MNIDPLAEQMRRHSYLSDPPIYHKEKRGKTKLTQEVQEAINELLAANEEKKLQGLRKQLLKKCDILDLLQEQGVDIGYTNNNLPEKRPMNYLMMNEPLWFRYRQNCFARSRSSLG